MILTKHVVLVVKTIPLGLSRSDRPNRRQDARLDGSQVLLRPRAVGICCADEVEQPGEDEVRSLRRNIASGGGAVLARTVVDRIPVGAGEFTAIVNGVTEVTSIGVRPAYRRRGIAAAMTGWLARAARASNGTYLFLMANEPEERIYARVGFMTKGTVLHISR